MSAAPRRNHVAFFLPDLGGGGAERVAVRLAQELALDARVDIVLARARGPLLGAVPDGVRVVDLSARHTLTSLPAVVRYLRAEGPDVVLSLTYVANFVAVLARLVGRSPTRLVISERVNVTQSLALMRPMKRLLARRLIQFAYPRADAIVVPSEGVAVDLGRHVTPVEGKLEVIPNPVILEPPDDRHSIPWPFPDDGTPVAVAVGRLHPAKDFPTLLRAAALVRASRPLRVLILGDGPDRGQLEALATDLGFGDDLALPGYVPNPSAYVAGADVFVLSSRTEGLPNALIEALPLGVPVVATDCESGPREILAEGRHGRLVPVADHVALGSAIAAALDGEIAPPATEAWLPYRIPEVVARFRAALFGP